MAAAGKLLEGALIKLSSAVSRLARAKTARDILEAIADGQRDPKARPPSPRGRSRTGGKPSSRPWRACSSATTTPG